MALGVLAVLAIAGTVAVPEVVASATQTAADPSLPSPSEMAAAADTTVLVVRTFDANLDFEPARLAARQGEIVRIVYENESVLPHNLVIMKDPDDLALLGEAAYTADNTGFVPLEHEDRMIAYTDLASPGETVEVTFTMPAAGDYTFVCLVPGHYNSMLGLIRATE